MLILNIATQPIKTEYAIQTASLELHTTLPKLQMETQAAKLEIRQPKGTLEIDQTPCRYAYGIKNMQDFSRDNAQEAKSAGMEAIGTIVEEGNRLAHIESNENVIAAIATEKNTPAPRELNWGYIPLPDIRYKANPPQINVIDGKLTLDFLPGKVQADFKPGKMDINVTQYPSVKMWTSENKIDLMI